MGENINKVDTTRFRVPWWYRNEFNIDDVSKNTELIFPMDCPQIILNRNSQVLQNS